MQRAHDPGRRSLPQVRPSPLPPDAERDDLAAAGIAELRLAAIPRLGQGRLARVAVGDSSELMRAAAVRRMPDSAALQGAVAEDRSLHLRTGAGPQSATQRTGKPCST